MIIKVFFIMGFVFVFFYVFWEVWVFIRLGFYFKERKVVRGIVFVCFMLFILGVLFGYFIIVLFVINFLMNFILLGVDSFLIL